MERATQLILFQFSCSATESDTVFIGLEMGCVFDKDYFIGNRELSINRILHEHFGLVKAKFENC